MRQTASQVALAVILSICSCASQTATHDNSAELYKGVDYKTFVVVAAVDPAKSDHVTKLLHANGIPNVVEGSVVYGVSVPPSKKDKAIAVLKADSRKHAYYIKF
jgi:hypothetical protein